MLALVFMLLYTLQLAAVLVSPPELLRNSLACLEAPAGWAVSGLRQNTSLDPLCLHHRQWRCS
jgi:hypothetical protein